ncbi:hypothetical protein CBR_g12511 [Chara braunii]|uniref:Uncharacterized protein n=1 Tax=Chara braunii TaxID=69332 RepID=A0A388JSN6_CHABU|nr:hypothetical protein CBR_g12511 [Chara braunii]|eukprot:GBG60773.1 hypothetical protein CBR_g12511 [Chara braunii]
MEGGGFTSKLMGDYDGPATMELGHAGDPCYVERRDGRHAYGGSEECVDSHADRYRSLHLGPGADRGGSSDVDARSYCRMQEAGDPSRPGFSPVFGLWGRGDGQEGHARAWRGAQNENLPASPFGMQLRTGSTGQQRLPSPTANWNVNDVTDVGSRQRLMNSRSRSSSSPPVHRPTVADGLQSAGSMQVGVGHGTSAGWQAGHDAAGSTVGGGRCNFPAEETRQPGSEVHTSDDRRSSPVVD